MKEQFDKRLVDKIKDSFQQHEEPFDLQEFEKFKKLYFRRKNNVFKRVGAFWWMGIAASLIAGLLFLTQFQFTDKNYNQNPVDLLSSNDTSKVGDSNSTDNLIEEQNITPENASSEQLNLKPQKNLENLAASSPEKAQNRIEDGEASRTSKGNLPTNPTLTENVKSRNDTNTASEKSESLNELSKSLTMTFDSENDQKAQDYIKSWLGDGVKIAEQATVAKLDNKSEPIKLGVLVAPQTISNATQPVNFGAGMMSEFSFSKRLKLDVGLAYARQQMTPSTSGGNSLMVSDASEGNTLSMSGSSLAARSEFSGNFINSTREFSFGQLEIPINLKYKVLENKSSDVYLISGFSNMVYLNQQNTTTFSTANLVQGNFVGTQPSIQTFTQTESPSGGSGNIDSGQMLNLGFGYEQNLKNGTFLSIEPFYKFSLGDQTFNNQQFSIGGINLRMNFQLKNKKE